MCGTWCASNMNPASNRLYCRPIMLQKNLTGPCIYMIWSRGTWWFTLCHCIIAARCSVTNDNMLGTDESLTNEIWRNTVDLLKKMKRRRLHLGAYLTCLHEWRYTGPLLTILCKITCCRNWEEEAIWTYESTDESVPNEIWSSDDFLSITPARPTVPCTLISRGMRGWGVVLSSNTPSA